MQAPDAVEWKRMSPEARAYYLRGMRVGMEAVATSILGEVDGAELMKQMDIQLKEKFPEMPHRGGVLSDAKTVRVAGAPVKGTNAVAIKIAKKTPVRRKRPVRRKA